MIRNSFKIGLGLLLSFTISSPANAWNDPSKSAKSGTTKPNVNSVQNKAANCTPSSSLVKMEWNNVSALIETGGSMWQDRSQGNAAYEVPIGSGNTAIYSGALWMGGEDVNGQLKLAAVTFRQGNDFWTGPLTVTPGSGNGGAIRDFGAAEIEPDVCEEYDQFYVTRRSDISTFRAWFRCGQDPDCDASVDYPNYSIPKSIIDWPAHGDIGRFQDQYLAPFYDVDNNGFYDPAAGDYPKYDLDSEFDCNDPTNRAARAIFGDVNYWWVFNDKGNIHTESNGDPIGMEVRAQAFAFATNDEVNNMTFYNYEMINRSTQTLTETYFGQFVDADLGCSEDDFVGCDVSRGLGFAYNADATDSNPGCNGALPYQGIPPAIGVDFFEGPFQDVDGIDNAIGIGPNEAVKGNGIGYGDDIVDNERFGMRKFLYFDRTTGGSYGTDPNFAGDYYDYMKGIWLDGSRFVYGGNGHVSGGGTIQCDFTFPGSSDLLNWGTNGLSQAPWDETSAGNAKGDRRFLQSAGPFTLEPGALNNITVGVVWARATNGDNLSSVEVLKIADQKAQALFENCFRIIDGPDAPELTVQELDKEIILYITNSQNGNNPFEDYSVKDPFIIVPDSLIGTPQEWDTEYKFQGYQIFQLESAEVSAPELENPDLARLVAQFDYKDGIGQLINYEFNESIGVAEPSEKVQANGSDLGIQHAIKVSTDLFAQGDSRLVNHKKYYYMARAYAHNEFQPYDPADSDKLNGQKKPFLPGRKNAQGTTLRPVTAIPHITDVENDGTIINAEFGATPQITRIEGQGNAQFSIDLDQATENAIVSDYTKDVLKYKAGAGPIQIRVIDPLNVVAGDYRLRFLEDSGATVNHVDSAYWELVNITTQDTVTSVTSIAQNNEQLIPEWGISVQVEQYSDLSVRSDLPGGGFRVDNTSEFIEATIEYSDGTSEGWLTGVSDIDGPVAQNWIRSGTVSEDATTGMDYCTEDPVRWNDYSYLDDGEVFESLLGGIIAPYSLTSARCRDDIIALANTSTVGYSGMEALQSIDLVMTSDTSKWTRCPVIEMQYESVLSIGNAAVGKPRASNSVDKYGNDDGTGTGMGWFPGYVINVSTGERLNMAFGEDSWLGGDNGRDMMWNPSSRETSTFGDYIWGGKHTIYIFRNTVSEGALSQSDVPVYDGGTYMEDNLVNGSSSKVRRAWRGCTWVMQPMLERGATTGTSSNPYAFITEDVKVRVRVSKAYENYETSTGGAENAGYGLYSFTTEGISTTTDFIDTAVSALDIINVVPNPYYAYSDYEENTLDNRIKITNLPDVCDIKIFNTSGTLIRTFSKDSKITSVDWDLKNGAGIPIASGVYIIHVNVDGVGEKIVKWFGAMRPPDLENF